MCCPRGSARCGSTAASAPVNAPPCRRCAARSPQRSCQAQPPNSSWRLRHRPPRCAAPSAVRSCPWSQRCNLPTAVRPAQLVRLNHSSSPGRQSSAHNRRLRCVLPAAWLASVKSAPGPRFMRRNAAKNVLRRHFSFDAFDTRRDNSPATPVAGVRSPQQQLFESPSRQRLSASRLSSTRNYVAASASDLGRHPGCVG